MTTRYDKYSWLETAFSEQVDSLNESYYFDRGDNQFFSVFITDFFLVDPTSTEDYAGNPYSEIELNTLAERISKLECNDTSILIIPRLTVEERKQMMQDFLNQQLHLLNLDELQNVLEAEDGRTYLDFGNLLSEQSKEDWKLFKRDMIEQKIDTFCNLQNVSLDTATLWTDKKMTSMSIDLTENNEDFPAGQTKQTKPWWKFW